MDYGLWIMDYGLWIITRGLKGKRKREKCKVR
jgi:hypothetical protein